MINHLPASHLTADELDAAVDGQFTHRITSHLATCDVCRTMLVLDQRLIAALAMLPSLAPSSGFADQVLAQLDTSPRHIPVTAIRSQRELAARRRVVGVSALIGSAIAAATGWVAVNPSIVASWSAPALNSIGTVTWSGAAHAVRAGAVDVLHRLGDAPASVVVIALSVTAGYSLILTGLRRLLSEPTANAGW